MIGYTVTLDCLVIMRVCLYRIALHEHIITDSIIEAIKDNHILYCYIVKPDSTYLIINAHTMQNICMDSSLTFSVQ